MSQKGDRRRHQRKCCRWAVRVHGSARLRDEWIADIGQGGVFVETLYPLRVGTRVELELVLEGHQDALRITGEVLWVRHPHESPKPGMGIRFIEPSPEVLDRIQEVVDLGGHSNAR